MNYKCTVCDSRHYEVIPHERGMFVECRVRSCGGECERYSVCLRCDDADAMHDGDYCVSCCADDVVADPAELASYTDANQRLIVRELAARLRVVRLDRKQAA